MAALAEFERDLLRERVYSGFAPAHQRGVVFGRRPDQRIKANRYAPKCFNSSSQGQPYRESATGSAEQEHRPGNSQAQSRHLTGKAGKRRPLAEQGGIPSRDTQVGDVVESSG